MKNCVAVQLANTHISTGNFVCQSSPFPNALMDMKSVMMAYDNAQAAKIQIYHSIQGDSNAGGVRNTSVLLLSGNSESTVPFAVHDFLLITFSYKRKADS